MHVEIWHEFIVFLFFFAAFIIHSCHSIAMFATAHSALTDGSQIFLAFLMRDASLEDIGFLMAL